MPEILVIHLKRFSYSRFWKNKLETFIDFPIDDLDLSTYIAQKNSHLSNHYKLYAICNHYGGMGSGHYTAFVRVSGVSSILWNFFFVTKIYIFLRIDNYLLHPESCTAYRASIIQMITSLSYLSDIFFLKFIFLIILVSLTFFEVYNISELHKIYFMD